MSPMVPFSYALKAKAPLSIAFLFLALTACVSRSAEPQESNTNWLFTCDSDTNCGEGLSCHCGACTRDCARTTCPRALACVEADACEESVPSCQAECSADSDCRDLSAKAECQAGVCVMPSGGLSEKAVSKERTELPSSQPSSSAPQEPAPIEAGVDGCRYAYVEYPVGATVPLDDCNNQTCTCSAEGTLDVCGGTDIGCNWQILRRCSVLYPDAPPEQPLPSDSLQIKAALNSGMLSLSVVHSGGCAKHDYGLCLRDVPGEGPLTVDLVLVHDAHGDNCEDELETTRTYDVGLLYTDSAERNSTWSGKVVYGDNSYVVADHRAESCSYVYPAPPEGVPELQTAVEGSELCAPIGVDANTTVISIDAAQCVALESGFSEGLSGWQTTLSCDGRLQKAVWQVMNTTRQDNGAAQGGDVLVIDAQSGEILETLGWSTALGG